MTMAILIDEYVRIVFLKCLLTICKLNGTSVSKLNICHSSA